MGTECGAEPEARAGGLEKNRSKGQKQQVMRASNLGCRVQKAPPCSWGLLWPTSAPHLCRPGPVGQGTCSSQSPGLPNLGPWPVDSGGLPTPRPNPQPVTGGAPPGPRPTSLGLSCGGGVAARRLGRSVPHCPREAAAHNCE